MVTAALPLGETQMAQQFTQPIKGNVGGGASYYSQQEFVVVSGHFTIYFTIIISQIFAEAFKLFAIHRLGSDTCPVLFLISCLTTRPFSTVIMCSLS